MASSPVFKPRPSPRKARKCLTFVLPAEDPSDPKSLPSFGYWLLAIGYPSSPDAYKLPIPIPFAPLRLCVFAFHPIRAVDHRLGFLVKFLVKKPHSTRMNTRFVQLHPFSQDFFKVTFTPINIVQNRCFHPRIF